MNLLQMSLSGAVLIVAIIVIRALFLHKLPKKTFTILWTLVLIRLLLPFSIPSSFSIYSWFPSIISARESYIADNNISERVKNLTVSKNIKETVIKESNMNKSYNYIKYDRAEDFEKTIFPSNEAIRIVGMIIGIIIFLFLYIRNMREFRTSLPINNAFIKEWLVKHKLKRKISVRYSDRISTPLSYGVFRPVILLPKNLDLSDTGLLSYILTHEYVHIKRFDIITKMFLIAALCVHWFNPTVWVMFIMFNRDIELSCDEAVVRIFGEKSKEEYAYALIDMEAKKGKLMPLCSNFSNNAVKERIISVMKIKKISLFMILFAVIFVTGTTAVFMTSAKEKENESVSGIDYKKIDDLKFKDYEKMSVAAYSDKVLKAVDSEEYVEALNKIANNKEFYEKRNIDEKARFFNYVLSPILARNRKYGIISGNIEINNNLYQVEYALNIEILNPEKLKVGEYMNAIESIDSGVNLLKNNLTKKAVKNAKEVSEKFRTGLIKISEKLSDDNLKITLEGISEIEEVSEMVSEKNNELESGEIAVDKVDGKAETRSFKSATKEDYDSLFNALKKPDYKNMKLDDFNKRLAKWASAGNDRMRMDRINDDINYENFAVNLTDEEREFVTTTINFSGLENAKKFKALYTKGKEELPVISISFSEDTKVGDGRYESYDCSYSFSYKIKEKDKITVAERDNAVRGFMLAAGKIWSNPEFSDLSKVDKEDIIKKLGETAKEHSGDKVSFNILEDQLVFDKINETIR